jgi:DNA replication protein DnaC
MAIAKGDGRYPKLLSTLAKTDVLILDDWGLAKLTAEHRRDRAYKFRSACRAA